MSRLARAGAVVLALVAATQGPAAVATDFQSARALNARMDALNRLIADPTAAPATIRKAAEALGAPHVGLRATDTPRAQGTQAPEVGSVPLPLVLTQLALQTGANYHVALRRAQAHQPGKAIIVESGNADLASIAGKLAGTDLEGAITRKGDAYVVHRPLVVWRGASLTLGKGDKLMLDRTAGAFVLDAGKLFVSGATIASTPEPNPRQAEFHPFVIVAMSGSAQVSGATFKGLGFGGVPTMTGLTFVSGGLYPSGAKSFVTGSTFVGSGPLSLIAAKDVDITENRFRKIRGTAIVLDGASGTHVEGNLIAARGQAHGIKATSESHDISIFGNVVAGSEDNGIFVDSGSHDIMIARNLVARTKGTAVGLNAVACTTLSGNVLVGSGQKGLSVEKSASILVRGNFIAENGSSGIWVRNQARNGDLRLVENRVTDNRAGVTGYATERLSFENNDFAGQTPRILSGELGQYTVRLLKSAAVTLEVPHAPTTGQVPELLPKVSNSCTPPERP